MKKRIFIIIKFSFPMLHYWKEATNYLKNPHRHIFYVEIKKEVSHNNRDIEFIYFKELVEKYVEKKFKYKCLSLSCEQIAENLIEEFDLSSCVVLEDNENGAEVIVE